MLAIPFMPLYTVANMTNKIINNDNKILSLYSFSFSGSNIFTENLFKTLRKK